MPSFTNTTNKLPNTALSLVSLILAVVSILDFLCKLYERKKKYERTYQQMSTYIPDSESLKRRWNRNVPSAFRFSKNKRRRRRKKIKES